MRLTVIARGGKIRASIRAQLALCTLALAALAGVGASANSSALADGIRPQDEIFLVNVRPIGGCCDPASLASGTQFESYQAPDDSGCRQWQTTSLAAVTSGDASISTVLFVHGNRLTNWDAKCEGLAAYRRIVRNADAAPIRFVIFSWPSAQISGPLKDVRVKAARTRPAGCQLAWFVDQLPAETPLTMVGFSYGARIVTGALHILGGGSLGGTSFAELQHPHRQPVNAVLLASALNSDWLCPGHYHGQAMTMVHQMVLVNNPEDRAMKYYHFSTTCGRPQALGYCGPTCIDPAAASKIVELNVGCYVGSEHNLFCYLSAPGVISEIDQFISAGGAVVAAY
jgi:pimeloyl-ACP methyl ester carboxylesterase